MFLLGTNQNSAVMSSTKTPHVPLFAQIVFAMANNFATLPVVGDDVSWDDIVADTLPQGYIPPAMYPHVVAAYAAAAAQGAAAQRNPLGLLWPFRAQVLLSPGAAGAAANTQRNFPMNAGAAASTIGDAYEEDNAEDVPAPAAATLTAREDPRTGARS